MVHSSMLRSQRVLIALGVLLVCIVLGFVARFAMRQPQVAEADGQVQADIAFVPQRFAGVNDRTYDFAWGDVDNDGDLDLAVGNYAPPERMQIELFIESSYVYENVDGQLQSEPLWISAEPNPTTAIAWGDVNNDGFLDLTLGNANAPDQIYLNRGGILDATPSWESAENTATEDLAWGDANGDGKIDLLVSGLDSPVRVYFSLSNTLPISPSWASSQSHNSHDVAWVHVDADDRPDVVATNAAGQPCIYMNSADGLRDSAECDTTSDPDTISEPGQRLISADFNQDGRHDLAIAAPDALSVYFNQNGSFSSTPQLRQQIGATSLAKGDVNHDGLPDLLFFRQRPGSIHTLINQNGRFEEASFDHLASIGSRAIAFKAGDVDQDGRIDIIYSPLGPFGGDSQSNNVLLLNQTPHYQLDSSKQQGFDFPIAPDVSMVDINMDGRTDLALMFNNTLSLYIDGSIPITPSQTMPFGRFVAYSNMTWADFDRDGDQDVAFADGSAVVLFTNDDGQLSSEPIPLQANLERVVEDMVWIDIDNDLSLDLIGCDDHGVWLLRNQAGTLTETAERIVQDQACTTFVAGDIDNDGDMDIIIAADNQHNYLYRNNGGQISETAVWESADLLPASDLDLGDLDNDGSLDLAVATANSSSLGYGELLTYRNIGGTFDPIPNWYANDTTASRAVRLADIDSDGWVDIVTGLNFYPNHNGIVASESTPLATVPPSSSVQPFASIQVEVGDTNGDGRLELFFSEDRLTDGYPILFTHLTHAAERERQFAVGLNIVDTRIDQGTYSVPYTLLGGAAREVRGYFAVNGEQWQPAVPTADTVTQSVAAGQQTFGWDVHASGLFGNSDNVTFKVEALPALLQSGIMIEPQVGRVTASSQPLSVRGSQVRVLFEGEPAAGAIVYRQPAGSSGAGQAVSDASGVPFRTDVQGYLQGHGALDVGDRLVALLPVSDMSAFESPFAFTETGKINLYYMSAAPTETGVDSFTVTEGGVQELEISAEHPLLLFDLDLSLEWDASQDAVYMAQLRADLQRTSEVLFDLFNGQVALGNVNLYHAKERWHTADVSIHASSTQRPSAILGGIVTHPLSETLATGEIVPHVYQAGSVRMSATWNRFGGSNGTLGEDWPRTLAHELGHYAFFLQDSYHGVVDNLLVDLDCQGTAMTDPYREDYSELLDSAENTPTSQCKHSLAALTTGRTDWETVQHFYPMLRHDAALSLNGPTRLPLDLTQVTSYLPATRAVPLPAPRIYLQDETGGSLFIDPSEGDAYLFPQDVSTVIPLTDPIGRLIEVRGARIGDRLCVFHVRTDIPRSGCETLRDGDVTLQLTPSAWNPSFDLQLAGWQTLTVAVSGIDAAADLNLRFYPSVHGLTQTLPIVPLAWDASGVYTAVITTTTWANAGHLHLWDGESSAERIERFYIGSPNGAVPHDFSDGSNNPINEGFIGSGPSDFSSGNNNPINEGFIGSGPQVLRSQYAPLNAPDNQVIVYNINDLLGRISGMSLETVSSIPIVPQWLEPVGKTYRFRATSEANGLYTIRFRYFARQLPPIDESLLRIYYLDEQNPAATWQPLNTFVNGNRNEAATQFVGEGIYMLGATLPLPTLQRGWNLFGYPLAQPRPITEALQSINNQYQAVYHFDAVRGQWQQYLAEVDEPFREHINTLSHLRFGQGYWIYAKAQTAFNLLPSDETATRDVSIVTVAAQDAFVNLDPPSIAYGIVENSAEFDTNTTLIALYNGKRCASTKLIEVDDQLGFVLTIPSSHCHLQVGDTLVFVLDGQEMAQTFPWDNTQATRLNLSR